MIRRVMWKGIDDKTGSCGKGLMTRRVMWKGNDDKTGHMKRNL